MKSARRKSKSACSHGPVGRLQRDGPQARDYRSPFVAVTFAMTVDGKITTKNFTPVDLTWMLQQLRRDYGVRTVACEGGATLFRALLEHDLVDQLNLTIAPYLFGGATAPTLTGLSKDFLPRSVRCTLTEMRTVGEECFLTYRIKRRRR